MIKEKTAPGDTMMQQMGRATQRIKNGNPTLEDYQLIMRWPAMAQMFMRSKK